ncbi:hypothetical protein DFA_05209 [Cavenderia fasciculata]|uniref:CCHC-type domain-containing protein n=1 Tax=Cavenderia fasciculata TaxID=261658 RepID=F4PNM6_CACFS|nr:uncharacterized protein DFA_05209 [Cavenderia fasciculata]EGG23079.1 hypothetical protein DFA_05209 [Cavenderia fasciculata]|eukprot:XP_004360930.1 hypothetical protein DFA_05209 [Cavenderia fasciculata]
MNYFIMVQCFKCTREGHYADQCNGYDNPPTSRGVVNGLKSIEQAQKFKAAAFGTANSTNGTVYYPFNKK